MRGHAMRRALILQAVLVLSAGWSSACAAGDRDSNDRVRPFEWNVFLDGWQLLGPFPKVEADPEGLATPFVKDESELRAGRVVFFDRKLFTWAPYKLSMINFRNGLKAQNAAGNNKVAYAWTQFSSPVAQNARLAIGYDDQFVAWLNGKEVSRGMDNMWASLDQQITEVELQAGTNTLLLKVANGAQGWEGLARLLPAEPAAPLLEFQMQPASNAYRLPVVEVELLDAGQKAIALHRCSGSRDASSFNSACYRLFANAPPTEPAFARFRVVEPGFSAAETTLPWQRLQTGQPTIPLMADQPVELALVDAKTRQPIEGATIWRGKDRETPVSDREGRISLPEFSPVIDRCYAVAPGFVATTVDLKWPRRGVQRVELSAGGRSVVGTVVSTSGEPIAGATITSGVSGGYSPTVVTDEAGRFELHSLPEDRTQIYPVIEAAGFVAKGRFGVDVSQPETTVRWELVPGATITGRIVNRESDKPVGGVTITTGDDRFGSNNPKATAKSKADGTYELIGVSPGETLIHAFSDDFAPTMQRVTATVGVPVKLDFTIAEGRPVSGVIRDKDGNPVPDVRLITDTWNGARMFDREARTDSEGRFVLAHMPDSAAEVHVLKRGFISQRDLMVTGGDTVELTLLPTIVHTISVRDAAKGQIVPDLQIAKGYLWQGNSDWSWQSNEWETTRYYDKLKGEMRIEISEQTSTYETAYRFRAAGFAEVIVNLPRDLSEGKSFDVRLRPAEVFEGRIVDASTGQPLEGVIVAAVSREDRLRADQYSNFQTPWQYIEQNRSTAVTSTTDADGLFRLPALGRSAEGAGLVLLSKDGGFHFVEGDLFVAADDAKAAMLELPMPESASLSGRLTIAGEPVAGAHVRIQWQGHGGAAQNDWNRSFGVGGQVTTDADGRFSFARLGPGIYQLNRVFPIPLGEGSTMTAYLDAENVTLLPGQDVVHDLVRPAGLKLSGIAKTSDGEPVSGCVVYVAKNGGRNERLDAAIADAAGHFSFDHVPPGDYQLSAELHVRRPEGYYDTGFTGATTVSLAAPRDDVQITLTEVNRNATPTMATPITGTLAPEFSIVPSGPDQPVVLSQQSGKVTAVCFWQATDEFVTALNTTYRQFQQNQDIVFVPVFTQGLPMLELQRTRLAAQPEFPVFASEEIYAPPLADLFSGAASRSLCYVIGRDGRFTSEPVAPTQLAAAIEQALAASLDGKLSIDQTAVLDINLTSDGLERGIPGAKLKLRAIGADGETVRADQYSLAGTPRRIHWRYPTLGEGGKLEVELSGQGIKPQTQSISNSKKSQSLSLENASPRRITGTVVNLATKQPEPDVIILFLDWQGQAFSGKSDADGKLDVPSYPGTFYVTVSQDARFAVTTSPLQSVTVGESSEPAPIEIKVAPAATVIGRVLDAAGKPVSGAMVMLQLGGVVSADEEGRFELRGIPSVGTTQLWASTARQEYGSIRVTDPAPEDEVTIRIGQGLNDQTESRPALTIGQAIPSLEVTTLDGTATNWQAAGDSERLVVIGALWHPATKRLIEKARSWCKENGKPLQVLSLDWSLEQASRESESLELSGETVFAGPGTLKLKDHWSLASERLAVLVAKDGTAVSQPLE
ncbi:hypothetical protein GC176_06250 [bacterium]|nr:hypothetical protein [bacterium]